MNKVDKLLKIILEDEITAEMKTCLMELALLIDEERVVSKIAIPELSDEEIQNAAFQFIKPPKQKPCKSDGYNEYDLFEAFKAGVRYREQLKSKQ